MARRRTMDEALIAEYEAERARVILKIEEFCDKCEYRSDPGSCEDCELNSITGCSTKDSKIDQNSP
jgi:hypothetical protein